jgi:hypothetical protein
LPVGRVHDSGILRGDGFGDSYGGGAGCLDAGPRSDAGSGEQGGTEGSAFFGFEQLYGVAVDIGLDLSPEGASGSSAS